MMRIGDEGDDEPVVDKRATGAGLVNGNTYNDDESTGAAWWLRRSPVVGHHRDNMFPGVGDIHVVGPRHRRHRRRRANKTGDDQKNDGDDKKQDITGTTALLKFA